MVDKLTHSKDIPQIPFLKREDNALEFEVMTLEHLFTKADKLDHSMEEFHRLDFYNIIFITSSEGEHYVDFQSYTYQKGSMLFISKGQVNAFRLNPKVEGYILLFTEAFLTKNMIHSDILSFYRLYNYHLNSPLLNAPVSIRNDFLNLIEEIYGEYNQRDNYAREEVLQLLLKLLLLKAERLKQHSLESEKNSEWFHTFSLFRGQLISHLGETRNANDYADMLGCSYKHLNIICKAFTGSTAKQFIDDFLVLEIKRQLAISDTSVKELSYKLGFDEPTNFVKYFKRHTNSSPSRFKKSLTH